MSPAAAVKGDPFGESALLIALQSRLSDAGIAAPAQGLARGLSHFGEHALGWMALSAAGMAVDADRRRDWASLGVAAVGAHAASVVLKRIVRRPRPHDPRIRIGVGTPSKLSFPSSHATSTTAALVSAAHILGTPAPLLGVPVMALSRLVLGVHYPSDVALGSLVGLASAEAVRALVHPKESR